MRRNGDGGDDFFASFGGFALDEALMTRMLVSDWDRCCDWEWERVDVSPSLPLSKVVQSWG